MFFLVFFVSLKQRESCRLEFIMLNWEKKLKETLQENEEQSKKFWEGRVREMKARRLASVEERQKNVREWSYPLYWDGPGGYGFLGDPYRKKRTFPERTLNFVPYSMSFATLQEARTVLLRLRKAAEEHNEMVQEVAHMWE